MTNANLEWALFYQNQGLSIIPVREKLPLIKWKEHQATPADANKIQQWFQEWPDADLGMVTGPVTQRLVLDIDGPAGADSIKNLPIPTTQTVRTRRGVQYHFRWPVGFTGKTTVAGILPGVDVRGEGGYVKMPPSKCSDGTYYAFHTNKGIGQIELAEPPKWLLESLWKDFVKPVERKISPEASKENWISEIIDGVGMGDRHEAFKKLAGYYFNIMHPEVAAQHLREWNSRNTPPMEDMEEKIADMTQRFKNGEYESKFLQHQQTDRKLELLSSETLAVKFSRPPEYLVPGLIPKATRTIFSGWQGRGKSFTTTDLVIEIARKKGFGKWLGEFNVAHGPVIYIDNENASNLAAYRLDQLLRPKQLTSKDVDLHWVIGHHWKITNEKDYRWLMEQAQVIKPVLIVADSLASIHTLDENSSKDSRYLFDDLIAPICEEFGCGFLCIDHESKGTPGVVLSGGKRLRGSGAKGDAVDTILSLNEKEGVIFLEHSKARYSKRHKSFAIGIETAVNGVSVEFKGYLDQ